MSTVRATSRVQAIRSRTASIQQRNAEKAAAEAAKNATKPKTTATPKVQEIRDRTAAIQQRNAEKVQGTGSVKTNVSTVKSPAKAPNKDTVSISARSNASSYAGQYKDMSDKSLDKTINNLKNTIKNSKSGTATYYAQKALEGYEAEKERRTEESKTSLNVSVSGEIKRYEDYRKLSDKSSNQYKMQQMAYTDDLGFRRINIEGLDKPAYMAAFGSYYTNYDSKGVVFEITLENGNSFYCVAGDMKSDKDTDATRQYTNCTKENADIIEFIMDTENKVAKQLLPKSEGGKGYGVLNFANDYKEMSSPIKYIKKIDNIKVLGD